MVAGTPPRRESLVILDCLESLSYGYSPIDARYRSASSAAMQPVPAEVMAWR